LRRQAHKTTFRIAAAVDAVVVPHPAFKLTNYWVIRHDRHHYKHLNTNFASIFPYWDMMFGTHK